MIKCSNVESGWDSISLFAPKRRQRSRQGQREVQQHLGVVVAFGAQVTLGYAILLHVE